MAALSASLKPVGIQQDLPVNPHVKGFLHEPSQTVSYVVREPEGQHAVVIDPVLDYEPNAARTSTESADLLLTYVNDNNLKIDWILETHAHADHLSAAQYLKETLDAPVAIGRYIRVVQQTFAKLFNLEDDFQINGSQFDRLLNDGDCLKAGALDIRVMHTPGHTPACVTYLIGDAAFVGDTLFLPEQGTARADFPGGDARRLYHSIQKIYELPEETRLFVCHDYPADASSSSPEWFSTVAQQRQQNTLASAAVTEDAFVKVRESRDEQLEMPKLILPAIQFNIRAGALPKAEENGVAYLKIPVNVLR